MELPRSVIQDQAMRTIWDATNVIISTLVEFLGILYRFKTEFTPPG